jgi:hypothetical protein
LFGANHGAKTRVVAAKDPTRFMRAAMVLSATMLALVAIWFLQSKFEGADRKAAVGIVNDYRSKAGRSVPEVLAERHPNKPQSWQVHTESSCMQHERVDVDVDGKDYAFIVDINGPAIHPGNPDGKAVLAELDEARAPSPADSASTPK